MQNSPETPKEPKPRPQRDFDDPHFHDEEEAVPADDVERYGNRPPAQRKHVRRLPPRRHYEDD
jgi:hypothetical protein